MQRHSEVDYFTLKSDKRGRSEVLAALRDAGVNLLAYTGFPRGGGAQLDFIPRIGVVQGRCEEYLTEAQREEDRFPDPGEDRPARLLI